MRHTAQNKLRVEQGWIVERMTERTRRGRWTAVIASLAVHIAVLALLVLSTPALRLPTARLAPDLSIDLTPPLVPEQTIRSKAPTTLRPTAAAQAAAAATPKRASLQPVTPIPPAPSLPASPPIVAPPTPAPASPAAPALAAGARGDGRDWRVRPEGGDLQGLARAAIGCGHAQYLRLTSAEQAACDRRYADLRGTEMPHIDSIPPAKRAYYDAVARAYAKMHAGTPTLVTVTGDSFGVKERWAAPTGAHLPAFGCKVPFGIPRGWKPAKGGPPHSLKLGALPCYLTPPSGFLTEEADVPDPTTLGPRR